MSLFGVVDVGVLCILGLGCLGCFLHWCSCLSRTQGKKGNPNEPTARALIVNTDFSFITYLSQKKLASVFVEKMGEAIEQLKRKVASLTKESEELQRYKRDVDWLKTVQKKLVRDGFD